MFRTLTLKTRGLYLVTEVVMFNLTLIDHSGSADDLFHKSISGLMVAIFRTTFKSTTTTITVEDNFNCEKLKNLVHVSRLLSEIVLFSTVYEACELVVE